MDRRRRLLLLPWMLAALSCETGSSAPRVGEPGGPEVVYAKATAPSPRAASPSPPADLPRTFYVSDCAAGADPDCVPGHDGNDGRTPAAPWRSYEKARTEFSRLAAGDSIAFAQGGAFRHAGAHRFNNARCRADAPCTLESYRPPWASGDEGRPRIVGGNYGFEFSTPGRPRQRGGYVVRGLAVRGDGDPKHARRWGIFIYQGIDDVLLEDLVVENFAIGVHLASGEPPAESERIVLRDSRIADNSKQGWLGGGPGLRIENNEFENNGFASASKHIALRHHNLYLSRKSTEAVIRGNTLHRASLFDHDANPATPAVCHGTSLVVHGVHRGLVIEDNLVYEEHASAHCWGISIDGGNLVDAFERLAIRRNRVIGVGSVSIGCTSCADAVIENNAIVQQDHRGFVAYGIMVPTKRRPASDGPTSRVRVRHNSLYFGGADAIAIKLGEEGEGYALVGNAIAHAGRGRLVCYELSREPGRYEQIDHNTCHHAQASRATWVVDRGRKLDLAAWRAQSGFDAHSGKRPPNFAAPEAPAHDLALTAGSTGLIDAAAAAACPGEDLRGVRRPQGGGCDIGAFELPVDSKPARAAGSRPR